VQILEGSDVFNKDGGGGGGGGGDHKGNDSEDEDSDCDWHYCHAIVVFPPDWII
jgi:hypothetical protein